MSSRTLDAAAVSVFIVDDDEIEIEALHRIVQRSGPLVTVSTFTDPADALANLPAEGPTAIICDYNMPGASGLEWLPDFVRADAGPVIIMSGQGDEQIAADAFRCGAADYLIKSRICDDPTVLHKAIREGIRRHHLEHCNRDLARQLKVANGALGSQNERLAELSETAHRFVDNVAHEFRTPLAVIKEFASIMADGLGGATTPKQDEFLAHIDSATGDLAQLVDDFLDSSKLKAGSLRVDRRRQPLSALLDHIRPLLEARATARGIRLVEQIPAGLPCVFIDLEQAGRILVNLVVNAIKFSPPNQEVTISARLSDDCDVVIEVTDHGCGLPPDEVAAIFERFHQVGDIQRSTVKGFGLGLDIARELAWLNLGSIGVRSEEGAGSTFSLTLCPFDPHEFVPRYLDAVEAWRPSSCLSMLEAKVGTGIEEVRARLASISYPMDLVLRGVDGASLLLIGVSDQPDKWAARLEAAAPDVGGVSVMLRTVGTWPSGRGRSSILSIVLGQKEVLGGG